MPTPGIGEAVVRVRAVGINHVDLDVRAGTARIPLTFPHILGREFAGEVAAIGDPAPSHKAGRPVPAPILEGDRVWVACRVPCATCEFCASGRDNLCEQGGYFGMDIPGGYAEYVKVPISSLQRLASKNATLPELQIVMNLVAEGKLKPVIHATFPLAQAAEAHRVVGSREIFGKVVLIP